MHSRPVILSLLSATLSAVFALLISVPGVMGALPAAQATPAAEEMTIELRGLFAEPRTITVSDLQGMAVERIETTYVNDDGEQETHEFTGVLLWAALIELGIALDPDVAEDPLDKFVVLTAVDGYVVVISLGEIAPSLGGQPYLLAWERDGEPLQADQQPIRLVTPGDKTAGRYIWAIASIDVRQVEAEANG